MRSLAVALAALVAFASMAAAQGETTPLASGWSSTTRLRRLTDVNAIACTDDRAFARGWGGGVASWDGAHWQELPELPGYTQGHTYGTRIASTPRGEVLVEASGTIARWDGASWTSYALTGWPPYGPIGGIAGIGDEVLAVGRGRIARREGTAMRSYAAGTWRELSAIAGTSTSDLWTAGQGGTLMHWDGQSWTRAASGTERWLGGLLVVGASDVWAWSEAYGAPTLLHFDGHAWSSVTPPAGGTVLDVASRAGRVWVLNGSALFERTGATWTSQLAPSDLGDDNHSLLALCATRTHLVVGASLGSVLTRAL